MREVLTVDAMRTIALLMAIEALYPVMRLIHVFLETPATTPPCWSGSGWPSRGGG